MKYSLFSTTLLAIGLATPAGAADNCSDILAHGAFEIRSESSKEQQGSAFLTWACSSQSSKKSAAGDAGGDVGFQLPNLPPIQAKGHAINSTSEEYRNEACSFSNGTFNHAEEFSQFASTVSRDLVQAWEACMNRYGTFESLVVSGPKNFTIYIRNHANGAAPPRHDGIPPNAFVIESITVTPGELRGRKGLEDVKNKMINASAAFLCQRADVYQDFSILPHVAGLEIPLGELYIPALEKPKSSASEMEIIGTWKGRWTPVSGAQASEVVLSINVRGGELVVEEANLRSGGPAEKEDYAKFEDNRLTFKQSTPNGSWVELNLKYGKLKGGAYPSDLGLPRTKEEGKIYDLEFMRSY